MLQRFAGTYLELGKALQNYRYILLSHQSPSSPAEGEQVADMRGALKGIRRECRIMALPVTDSLAAKLDERLASETLSVDELRSEWHVIDKAFIAELDSRLLLVIPSDRAQYWITPTYDKCGAELESTFEFISDFYFDAVYDLKEGANCFVCGRYTASVYHQMRVAEFALVAVADSIGLPEEAKLSWERMIAGIYSEIKKWGSTKPAGWKEKEKKYSDLCTWFTTMKNGWRNPASHVPRIYEEATARAMFSTIRGLFEHLKSYGITQSAMPRFIAKPGEDL